MQIKYLLYYDTSLYGRLNKGKEKENSFCGNYINRMCQKS